MKGRIIFYYFTLAESDGYDDDDDDYLMTGYFEIVTIECINDHLFFLLTTVVDYCCYPLIELN